METNKACPKVFISYSWVVGDKVLELAERLMTNGVSVVLDKWDLKPGHDKYAFMEQTVNDPSVDKVLIICDRTYANKANQRAGGVGDETVIISPEVYGKIEQEKFIPIVFETDDDGKSYIPHYIKSRIYIDLSEGNELYESEFETLLRNIFNRPLYPKPQVGERPLWLDEIVISYSSMRDISKQLSTTKPNDIKARFLTEKMIDETIQVLRSYVIPDSKPYDDGLLQVIDQMKTLRDTLIEYTKALMLNNYNLCEELPMLFEKLYNRLHEIDDLIGNQRYLMEAYDFFIWDLFICVSAFLLRMENFSDLNCLLVTTYFLSKDRNHSIAPCDYNSFRSVSRTIEDVCKPKFSPPNLITLQSHLAIAREYKPYITKESFTDTDLVLHQLFPVIIENPKPWNMWYPLTYVYHREQPQEIWIRLKSKKYCEKILPLFGAKDIISLKDAIIKSNELARKDGYRNSFEVPQLISNTISTNDIGILP